MSLLLILKNCKMDLDFIFSSARSRGKCSRAASNCLWLVALDLDSDLEALAGNIIKCVYNGMAVICSERKIYYRPAIFQAKKSALCSACLVTKCSQTRAFIFCFSAAIGSFT